MTAIDSFAKASAARVHRLCTAIADNAFWHGVRADDPAVAGRYLGTGLRWHLYAADLQHEWCGTLV